VGIDCEITLPPQARLRDVATVVGILHGETKHKRPLGRYHRGGWDVVVDAVHLETCPEMPECVWIVIGKRRCRHRYRPTACGV